MEFPHLLAGDRIPGPNIATRLRRPDFTRPRAGDDQIPVDRHGIGNREGAAAALADFLRRDANVDVDLSVRAESFRRLAGLQVNRHQVSLIHPEVQPRPDLAVAGPMRQAPTVDALRS